MATDTTTPDARVVEGSDGLLLEIDGQVVPNYDATLRHFDEGDVVTGRVVRIDNDEVLVDIGYKSEGVIPSNELSIRKSVDPHDEVELGEEVDALVLTKEDQDGRLIMSKKRARFEKAWRRIEAAQESGVPIEGNVIEVVKGGLIIDLGVRGFLPASLVDIRRVPNLDEFMGTTLETKVIELNRSRNNVVLSRRAVLEEERKEQRQEILDRLQPGLIVEGTISNIVDFGAFVDLNGIDGLIHISELSWSHVNHPSEVVAIGDEVQVKVLDIDRDRQRISLGLKQTQEDPWQRVVSMYNVGDELEGKVTKVVTFGAFVEILDGVEGLVHISELAPYHVENPREIVEPGVDIMVKILEIDSERRRLSLSAKRVENQILPRREGAPPPDDAPEGAGDLDDVRDLGLSEDVFAAQAAEAPGAADAEGVEATEPEAAADDASAEAVIGSDGASDAAEAAPEATTDDADADAAGAEAPAAAEEAPSDDAPEAASDDAQEADASNDDATADVIASDGASDAAEAASDDAPEAASDDAAEAASDDAAEAASDDAAEAASDDAAEAASDDAPEGDAGDGDERPAADELDVEPADAAGAAAEQGTDETS
jgi:small subunit ribosomal protein S1